MNEKPSAFTLRGYLATAFALAVLAILIAGTSNHAAGQLSPEVKFTDASRGGLQIVPASCPSSPHYVGDCSSSCDNGLDISQYPSCSCPSGDIQQGNQCLVSACPAGYTYESSGSGGFLGGGSGSDTCVFTGCPSGYTQQGSQCVVTSCSLGYQLQGNQCTFVGCPQGYSLLGGECLIYNPPAPLGDLVANPSILKAGLTSQISWSAQTVSSCTVSGTNGDSWSCSGASCNATTTEVSSAINAQTTYTLSCTGLDGSTFSQNATVNIVPKFNEQ